MDVLANSHFCLLSVTPDFLMHWILVSSHATNCFLSFSNTGTSFIWHTTPSRPVRNLFTHFWKFSGALVTLNGNLLKQNRLNGVMGGQHT